MAVLKIKANVKEQVKISEVKQGIELFSAIEGLIEHNTLVKSVCKGILDSLYSTLCDYEGCEDSDFVSFISPEDTATFFENYFIKKKVYVNHPIVLCCILPSWYNNLNRRDCL